MFLDKVRQELNAKLGDGWSIVAYWSRSEKKINKPILTPDHVRNWENADTQLYQAWFTTLDGNVHDGTFTSVKLAVEWLMRQEPQSNGVKV